MKKIKELFNNHKGLFIVSCLALLFFLIMLFMFISMFFGKFSNSYGDRLEGINEVEINDDKIKEIDKNIEENDIVEKSETRIQGKIVYINITFKESTKLDDAKSIATKALAYCYKFHIENQALAEMFGQDPDNLDKKTVQKAKKSDDFLRRCEDRISSIVGTESAVQQTQQEIIDMISDDTHISADVLLADPPEERHAVIRPMTVHGTLQHPQDDQEDDFAATL